MNLFNISNLYDFYKFMFKINFYKISYVKNVVSMSFGLKRIKSESFSRIWSWRKNFIRTYIYGQFFLRDEAKSIFIIKFRHYIDGGCDLY